MPSTLSPAEVRSLLAELAERLYEEEMTAGIRVVGGAALSLLDGSRRATTDIDAVIVPGGVADEVVAHMAHKHNLPANWLNDAALAYFPPVGPEDWTPLIRRGNVEISIGSLPMLLAMKLRANRGIRDSDDIYFLLEQCQVTSVEQAQEIYATYHAQDVLTEGAEARVRAWLNRSED